MPSPVPDTAPPRPAPASTPANKTTRPTHAPAPVTRRWKQRLATPLRWLHIYSSMFGLVAILFFSVTGFSLNHPDLFFGDARTETTENGTLDKAWLPKEDAQIARLEIVEHLRNTHKVRASLSEFRIDESECSLAFRGPAYTADVYVDRDSGTYEIAQVSEGVVAILNDLHRGRHTGPVWSLVIDITAITLSIVSITGLGLLLYIKRRRRTGMVLAALFALIAGAIYYFYV